MQEKTVARLGTVLFYLGGLVWIVFAGCKYGFGLDVEPQGFLPFHLAAIVPGVLLRHAYPRVVRYLAGRVVNKPS
jgi:hypothetical protein